MLNVSVVDSSPSATFSTPGSSQLDVALTTVHYLYTVSGDGAFSALTLLVGRQKGHPA